MNIFDLGRTTHNGMKAIAETLRAEPISQEAADKVIAELKKIRDGVANLEEEKTVAVDDSNFGWTWTCPRYEEENEEAGPIEGEKICWNCDETFRVKRS